MSMLEKAIHLLQTRPENKLEAIYMYIRFVNAQADEPIVTEKKAPIQLQESHTNILILN